MANSNISRDIDIVRSLQRIKTQLNEGKAREAQMEVNMALGKTPNDARLRATNALVLSRLGQATKAKAIIDSIAGDIMQVPSPQPEELETFKIFVASCYDLGYVEPVCNLLERRMVEEQSLNLLMTYLFSFVYLKQYKLMYKAALLLRKQASPTSPIYLGWTVVSLYSTAPLDTFIGPLDQESSLAVQVSQKMLEKHILHSKSQTNEPLLDFFIEVLHRNFAGPNLILSVFRLKDFPPQDLSSWRYDNTHEQYCSTLARGGYLGKLFKYLKDLFYRHFSEHRLLKQIVEYFKDKEEFQSELFEFMDSVTKTHPGYNVVLANLLLCAACPERSHKSEEYLKMAINFGSDQDKFYPDVTMYFVLVSPENQKKLLTQLKPSGVTSNREEVAWHEIVNDIAYQFTCRQLTHLATPQQRIEQAHECTSKYMRFTTPISRQYRKQEDLDPSSPYYQKPSKHNPDGYLNQFAILGAALLVSEHWQGLKLGKSENNPYPTKMADGLLITALCILQYCLGPSPRDNFVRILLGNIYARLGATMATAAIMNEVEPNAAQYCATGYLVVPHMLSTGCYQDAFAYLEKVEQLYRCFDSQNSVMLVEGYEKFYIDRISNIRYTGELFMASTERGLAMTQKWLNDYNCFITNVKDLKVTAAKVKSDRQFKDMAALTCVDTRELDMIKEVYETPWDTELFREKTGHLDRLWFKVRFNLVRILTLGISEVGGNAEEVVDWEELMREYSESIQDWKCFRPTCTDNLETPLFGLYPPVADTHFGLNIPESIAKQVEQLVKIIQETMQEEKLARLKVFHEIVMEQLSLYMNIGRGYVLSCEHDESMELNMSEYLQNLHWILEFFGVTKILMAVGVKCWRKAFVASKEAKNGMRPKIKEIFESYVAPVKQIYEDLQEVFRNFEDIIKAKPVPDCPVDMFGDDEKYLAFKHVLDKQYNVIRTKIRESYQRQVNEMYITALMGAMFFDDIGVS